nr:ABC transporter permease [Lachnospiraceae bacterium]
MKNLYTKLAVDGIKNNSKLYFPYMLSIAGVAAIYYILTYLVNSEAMAYLNGGGVLYIILIMGKAVIVIFSLLFLFYTNSFLAKKRNKEFALYNILGMNKKNVVKILAREALIEGTVSIFGGVLLGILFSKLFELLLCKLCGHEPDFMFYFSAKPIVETIFFFGIIVLVLFVFSVFKVAVNKPIELLRSTNSGEKEPKANFVIGFIGFIVLAFAYYVSMSIKSPVEGLLKFFGAVIMVIAATYALFVAGSVCLCKILKKNNNFYYSKKHFISVSGMAYRMKRNGAGLASICILSTMVLVMVASTGSLLIGKEDSLRKIYPKEILITVRMDGDDVLSEEKIAELDSLLDEKTKNISKKDQIGVRQLASLAALEPDKITIVNADNRELVNDLEISFVSIYPAEDYFKYESGEGLKDNEALVAYTGKNVAKNITIGDRQYEVVGKPDGK